MCRKQQVDSSVVWLVTHQGTGVCPKCWYIAHMHKLSIILHIYHNPIWVLIEYDNVCSDHTLHVISRADNKMEIQETGLYHMIFLQLCATHTNCIRNYNHTQYNFVGWPVLYTFPDTSHRFTQWVQKLFWYLPCKADVFVQIRGVNFHLFVIPYRTRQLQSFH